MINITATHEKNNVVCAIDVTDFDQGVVDLAATYAKYFKVRLELVHVTAAPNRGTENWPPDVGSPSRLIEESKLLDSVVTQVPTVVISKYHLSGLAANSILDFIDEQEPCLLVMGTHGRKGLAKIFGSVAAKVTRRSACPVMVLRQTTVVPATQSTPKLAEK